MLPIAVQCQGPSEAGRAGLFPSIDKSSALSLGCGMTEDRGPGAGGKGGGVVGGSIIYYQDIGQMGTDLLDQGADGRRLIEARNDRATVTTPVRHRSRLREAEISS